MATNIDPAIVEALHNGCGYEHGGYGGPCGSFVDALGEAMLDGLCDSPVWEQRHIGDLEQTICDGIVANHLAPLIAAAVDAARAEGDKQGAARVADLIKQEAATLRDSHQRQGCGRGMGCNVCVGVTARLDRLVRAALTEAAPHD